METSHFKTNINCNMCLANVTPFLDKAEDITHWEVDIKNPEKVLTVKGGKAAGEEAMRLVKEAGYTIEEKV